MRRIYYSLSVLSVAASVLFSTGCKKGMDCINQQPGSDFKLCNIAKLKDPNTSWKEAVFFYNGLGNPTSIQVKNPTEEQTNLQFRYDKQNRLSVYAACFEDIKANEPYLFYHKYAYPSDGTVVDSMFIVGILDSKAQPHVAPFGIFNLYTYHFDNNGRVRKTTSQGYSADASGKLKPSGAGFPANECTYDAKGNIVKSNPFYYQVPLMPYPYDNKINIRRTNKIWMFINQDYSTNNPLPASGYNMFGLPLGVKSKASFKDAAYFIASSINLNSSSIQIEYECDEANVKANE